VLLLPSSVLVLMLESRCAVDEDAGRREKDTAAEGTAESKTDASY
jgi:hypothetical protein